LIRALRLLIEQHIDSAEAQPDLAEDLIYDVGMHRGEDTDFYLQKGFRVVAVEANPKLVHEAETRFAGAIARHRLTIINRAIADHEGMTTLYVNRKQELWSTLHRDRAKSKSAKHDAPFDEISVPCTQFEKVLSQHGVPYYMKIDIEGADNLCLRALHKVPQQPRYVSVEIGRPLYEDLCHLYALGYRKFKIIDQAHHRTISSPYPAKEGKYVPHQFDTASSGPFGEETPGDWMDFEETFLLYRDTIRKTTSWYDLHAKLES
jgi:FkbM family methyltransferase